MFAAALINEDEDGRLSASPGGFDSRGFSLNR
jgi:hypothetical protein